MKAWCWSLTLTLLAACASDVHAQKAQRTPSSTSPMSTSMSHGLFSGVQVFRPVGTPRQFVLLLSENDAPREFERTLISKMTAAGAMVSAVPLAPFYRRLEAQDGKCTFAAGALENLARHVQAFEKLPTYLLPIIVGSGRASSFAYGVLAQAPDGTFASAMSLDFCPRLMFRTPLCTANALRWQATANGAIDLLPAASLSAPWTAMQGPDVAACRTGEAQAFTQQVAQATWIPAQASSTPAAQARAAQVAQVPAAFDAAYAALAAKEQGLEAPPAELAGLPLVELPSAGAGERFAVLLSGDGGWAGIDKGIAEALVQQGVPVVGFDSLRYFWSPRTPEGLARDLDRVIRYYAASWKRKEVILIGYSQGADVLPFAFNRLPERTRSSVRLTALLGLGQMASFEFHLSNWIGPSGDKPIAPEAAKLAAARTLCIYGQDERDSLCPQLAPGHVQAVPLAGGHHFGGGYGALAVRILDAVPK
jgi:type IV secretory pathway VirJ component